MKVKTTIHASGCIGTPNPDSYDSYLFLSDVYSAFLRGVEYFGSAVFKPSSTLTVQGTASFSGPTSLSGPVEFSGAVTGLSVSVSSSNLYATPQTITASVTMSLGSLNSSVLFVSASTLDIGIQIPSTATEATQFYLKRIDGNLARSVTVTPASGVLIDGSAQQSITAQYTSIHFMFYSSSWWII